MLEDFWGNFLKLLHDLTSGAFWKGLVSLIYAAWGYLIGGYEMAYISLIILALLDLGSGVWAAIRLNELSSKKGRGKTLVKFGAYAIIAIAARAFDHAALGTNTDVLGASMTKAAFIYLAGTEFMSIVENLGRVGVQIQIPLIEKLKEFLKPKQS